MQQRPSTTEEYQRKINIIVEYINNHLSETIDLDILAEMSGFSPWHFHRIVKAFLGENIGAFIIRMRVETAARLLRYSDMPVQEISWRVGYDVPSSLSKAFKQFYGISPNDYRKNKEYIIMRPRAYLYLSRRPQSYRARQAADVCLPDLAKDGRTERRGRREGIAGC